MLREGKVGEAQGGRGERRVRGGGEVEKCVNTKEVEGKRMKQTDRKVRE